MPNQNDSIKNLLSSEEKVLFTGSYLLTEGAIRAIAADVNNPPIPAIVPACIINTAPATIDINKSGSNTLVGTGYPVLEQTGKQFVLRYATLSSFKDVASKQKIGQVSGVGLYQENFSPEPTIQRFDVSSKSGIYKNVISVIIDFTQPIRVIYFIGEYNKCSKKKIIKIIFIIGDFK